MEKGISSPVILYAVSNWYGNILDFLINSELDRFDRVQLIDIVDVCRNSRSLSDAGRVLFAVSRKSKQASNDADRLKKYLMKFGLSWDRVREKTAD